MDEAAPHTPPSLARLNEPLAGEIAALSKGARPLPTATSSTTRNSPTSGAARSFRLLRRKRLFDLVAKRAGGERAEDHVAHNAVAVDEDRVGNAAQSPGVGDLVAAVLQNREGRAELVGELRRFGRAFRLIQRQD